MNPQLADSKGHGPPGNMPETLQPTYVGFVRTAKDACLLLEMLLSGRLPHVQRRPHERERAEIVKSGNVFIYEESISGVRRWTDGVNWSPSRILGNFLIYREVKQGYPGEGGKKTAIKKKPKPSPVTNGGIKKRSPEANGLYNHAAVLAASQGSNDPNRLELRDLYGSLVESYPFVEGGLVKKTITVVVEGVPHHLVSYYKAQDVLDGKLITPSNDPGFINITPRESLLRNQTFRLPVEHEELKINENSEAFVTQERAHLHNLYHPQPIFPPPMPMVPNDMHHHGLPASNLSPHGMPDHHGLPSAGMGMTYGPPPPFPYQNYRQMPTQAQTPLNGSMQGLAQNGLDALNNGTYQQQNQHGFVQDPQQSYVTGMGGMSGMASMPNMHNNFAPDPPRQMSFASPQSNGYTSPHPQPQVYPGQQSFRHPSIAAAQNGYGGYVPQAPQSDPSLGRDMQQHGGALDESQNNPDPNWPAAVYHNNNNTPGQYHSNTAGQYHNNHPGQFLADQTAQWP
ncbi:Gti1/Pac2 family-domain-containing protein [Coniochaeta sp. 2T2.1]|nr:Gti1/Pac2 family-domain-containing protein [Coniochaeta sp. 2T2.1]